MASIEATETNPDHPGRVTIVFWDGYVGASPTIVSAIQLFEESGFRVELVTREAAAGFPEMPAFSASTRVVSCRPLSARWAHLGLPGRLPPVERELAPPERPRSIWGRVKRRLSGWIGDLLLRADFLQLALLARHPARDRQPRFWIGVDLFGAAVAARFAPPGHSAYLSLEIAFEAHLRNRVLRKFKIRERSFSRTARPVIVQDEHRARLLCEENGFDEDRLVLVPNSPRSPSVARPSSTLRIRTGTDTDQKIVLHLGMMGPEVLSTEIAASTHTWPEDSVLVFHERYARTADDPVVREVKGAGGDRVAFSLEPVDLEDLPGLVSSADVGLVFYNPAMGENYSVITGASGKLAFCLQAGLPVICLDLPGFPDLMREYGCGICVTEPDGIGDALRTIFADPEPFRAGARRCFEERYAFDTHFAPVVDHIRSVLSPS